MITHNIVHPKNKNKVDHLPVRYESPSYRNRIGPNWRADVKKLDKLEYSKHVESYGLKIGDFVVSKNFSPPYTSANVQRVCYIEENHNTVEYTHDGRPMTFYLQMMGPHQPWKSPGDWFKKVPIEDLPAYWKDKV